MFSFISKKSDQRPTVTKRLVKSNRWIHRDELKVGMYVRELDVAWEDTHFMFQGFVVDNARLLRDVQAAAEWVMIESQKLATVSTASASRLCGVGRS